MGCDVEFILINNRSWAHQKLDEWIFSLSWFIFYKTVGLKDNCWMKRLGEMYGDGWRDTWRWLERSGEIWRELLESAIIWVKSPGIESNQSLQSVSNRCWWSASVWACIILSEWYTLYDEIRNDLVLDHILLFAFFTTISPRGWQLYFKFDTCRFTHLKCTPLRTVLCTMSQYNTTSSYSFSLT